MKIVSRLILSGVLLLNFFLVTGVTTFAQTSTTTLCGQSSDEIKPATQTTLPLPGGSLLIPDQKYSSRSGDYNLVFQNDGNLVVNDAAGKRIWGLDTIFPNYSNIKCVTMQKDGNLVARDASGNFQWAPLAKDPVAGSELALNPHGALQLIGGGNVVWSSDGDKTSEIDRLKAGSKTCRAGLELLKSNMYKYPEDPKTAPSGKRAWVDVYKEFTDKNLQACRDVGTFVRAHQGEPILSAAEKAIAASGVSSWESYFTGRLGIVLGGERIAPYCPGLHLSQFDCEAVTTRSLGSIAGAEKALDLLDSIDCLPATGWTYCRKLDSPNITIMGASTVTQSALDMVEKIYAEVTSKFKTPAYDKSKFDGFVVYLTNKGPWTEVSKLEPVGSMWLNRTTGVNEGDELRGGASKPYLWIDEQMICKRGVQTREENYQAGTRPTPDDDTERTFDQVVHEFGHSIMYRYGLESRVAQLFPGKYGQEDFAWAVQDKFSTPAQPGKYNADQTALLNEIFSAGSSFKCSDYKPDAQ